MNSAVDGLLIVPGSDDNLELDLEDSSRKSEISFTNTKQSHMRVNVKPSTSKVNIIPSDDFRLKSWESKSVFVDLDINERNVLLDALDTFSSETAMRDVIEGPNGAYVNILASNLNDTNNNNIKNKENMVPQLIKTFKIIIPN